MSGFCIPGKGNVRHDICHGHGAAHQAQQCATPREVRRGAGWSTCIWITGRNSTPSTTSAASWNRPLPRSRRCTGTARGAAGRTTGQGRSRSTPRHRARGQVTGKRRQAHTGPNRNTRSVTGVFNTAPFLAEPPHRVLDLEDFMGCG